MGKYTLVHFDEVPPQHFGQQPDKVDVRFYRDQLGMTGGGMTLMTIAPGVSTNAHKHKQQEETYLVISGEVEAKLDDEVIKLKPHDGLRVPKETARALRNAGKTKAVIVALGTPNTGPGDSINIPNFWE